ncbi:MAG: SRPBCC family protein [Puniceicoccales bacterium]|nr:SRPBCC family protein [Puniceicoccales bacterium]
MSDKPAYSPSAITSAQKLSALRTPPKLKAGTHRFFCTSYFTCPPEKVFAFFADVQNLRKTTPPDIEFTLLSPETTRMGEGTLLTYRLRLAGIRFGWQTRILSWDPPMTFLDVQAKGPFNFWKHKHLIADERWRVRMDDEILYRLPFWPLGEIAAPWVAGQLERIFTYRRSVMQSMLNE